MQGGVDLVGWLHTEVVYLPEDSGLCVVVVSYRMIGVCCCDFTIVAVALYVLH